LGGCAVQLNAWVKNPFYGLFLSDFLRYGMGQALPYQQYNTPKLRLAAPPGGHAIWHRRMAGTARPALATFYRLDSWDVLVS